MTKFLPLPNVFSTLAAQTNVSMASAVTQVSCPMGKLTAPRLRLSPTAVMCAHPALEVLAHMLLSLEPVLRSCHVAVEKAKSTNDKTPDSICTV